MKRTSVTAQNIFLLATVVAAAVASRLFTTPDQRVILEQMFLLALAVGRFAILTPVMSPLVTFSPYAVAGVTVATEILIATFVTINVDLLQRLPRLGPHLKRLEDERHDVLLQHPWMRRLAELGVATYVALPVPGTGSIGGTLLGRLLGLTTVRLIATVTAGTIVGSVGLAAATAAVEDAIEPLADAAWLGPARYLTIAVLVVVLVMPLLRELWRATTADRNSPPAPKI